MKHIVLPSVLTVILGMTVIVGAQRVTAQETQPEVLIAPSPVVSDVIVQRDSVATQIEELRASLRGQILEYREAESAFIIARGELQKLQTLASSENAVAATKKAQSLRTLVLITYTKLLRLSLLETTTLSLPVKTKTLTGLDIVLADLEEHQVAIQKASTRPELQVVADDFDLLVPRLVKEADFGRAALRAARLRNSFTATNALVAELEVRNASAPATLKQAERNRAFDQTKSTLKATETKLQQLERYLAIADTDEGLDRNLEESLSGIYAGNAQVISYVQEMYQNFFQDTP